MGERQLLAHAALMHDLKYEQGWRVIRSCSVDLG